MIQRMCDICGQAIPDRYINAPIIDLTIAEFKGAALIPTHYDFCPECSQYMSDKIKAAMQERKSEHIASDEIRSASSEKETNQNNPTKSLHYIGFSSHDCESWYECPTCKKKYSGYGLKNNGSEFECACGQKLYSPV